jgi:hypothetical protein
MLLFCSFGARQMLDAATWATVDVMQSLVAGV